MSGALVVIALVIVGVAAWLAIFVALGIVFGGVLRSRDRQVPPSPSDEEDES